MQKLALVVVMLLLGFASNALAANTGLLMLTTPEQRLDINYQFLGQQQAISSKQHQLTEDYNFKIQYAVVKPSLLRGVIDLKLQFDQKQHDSNSISSGILSGMGFLYDINGVFFEGSAEPAAFSLNSAITEVAQPFTNSYQLNSTTYGLQWSLLNKRLPATFRFTKGYTQTSGLVVDSKSTSDQVTISSQHNLGISQSTLEIYNIANTYIPTQGASRNDKSYEVRFNNDLKWDANGKNRTILARLLVSEATGINHIKNISFTETVLWDWGKSLRSGVNYAFFNSGGDAGPQIHNNGGVWLQHLLFKSLTTRIDLNARKDEYPDGYDQEMNGRLSLGYVKQLPRESMLNLNGYQQLGVIKRQLGAAGLLHILNEKHQVVFGVHIYLVQPNVVESSITVRNADPLKRLPPYALNSDYRVVVNGAQTEITPVSGGAIVEGDNLLIDYDYQVDPRVDTATSSYGMDGSLMLLNSKYRIYGNFNQSRQDKVSTQPALAGLVIQSTSRIGAETKWSAISLISEYETFDSDTDKHQEARVAVRYQSSLRNGTLLLSLSDNYRWYEPVNLTSGIIDRRSAENSIVVSEGYSTNLFSTIALTLNGNYQYISGATQSDLFTLNNSLNWSAGRLSLSLLSGIGMRHESGRVSYDEHVRFQLSRYF